MKDKLIHNYTNSSVNNMEPLRLFNKFSFSFLDGAKINIDGPIDEEYEVFFINNETQELVYKSKIKNNMWSAASPKFFIEWKLQVKKDGQVCAEKVLDLKGKKVKILLDTRSLGDILAYAGSVIEFQKKHECFVDCIVLEKTLCKSIDKANSTVNFYDQNTGDGYDACYKIGYPVEKWQNYILSNPKLMSLTEVAPTILGLEKKEYKIKLSYPKAEKPSKPYVCIATQSTCQAKYWNNAEGWEKVIKHLNSIGYDVWCIDRFSSYGNRTKKMNKIPIGAIDKTGDFPITERMSQISNADFFIGLGSGLSWLAWNVGVPVVLISGFSQKWAEFFTPYRILNEGVCHACWNDEKVTFDKSDWLWCPRKKDFECSKSISSDSVIKMISRLIKNNKEISFDWHAQSTRNKFLIDEQFPKSISSKVGFPRSLLPEIDFLKNSILTTQDHASKIKIIQISSEPEKQREKNSFESLSKLGYRYIRIVNPRYTEYPPTDNVIDGRKDWVVGVTKPDPNKWGLTSGHYGCWQGMVSAISSSFVDKDFTIICECDCLIKNTDEFKARAGEAVSFLEKTDYKIVRFESPSHFLHPNDRVQFSNKVSENLYLGNKMIASHCYMINPKHRDWWLERIDSVGWYTSDLWLNICFERAGEKMLIFKDLELTKQADGFSIVDNVFKVHKTTQDYSAEMVIEKIKPLILKTNTSNLFENFDWGDSSENFKFLIKKEFLEINCYKKKFDVEAGDIVIDLGASIGPFTKSILKNNPSKCYAVEALSKYIPVLNNNIGADNVKIFNHALPIDNEEFIEIEWEQTKERVKCVPFSKFLSENNISKIDFLKCDCEGGEYDVFKLENISILEKISKIITEFHIDEKSKNKFRFVRDTLLPRFKKYYAYNINGEEITQSIFDEELLNYCGHIVVHIDNRN